MDSKYNGNRILLKKRVMMMLKTMTFAMHGNLASRQ